MKLRNDEKDTNLDVFFKPQIGIYVDGNLTPTLVGLTSNPIGVRIENLLMQQDVLNSMYSDEDIIKKYRDNPTGIEDEYKKRISGHFSHKGGVTTARRAVTKYLGDTKESRDLTLGKDKEGKIVPTVAKHHHFSHVAQNAAKAMNTGITRKKESFGATRSLKSRSNLKLLEVPPTSFAIIMKMALGEENIDYDSSTESYNDMFDKILSSPEVQAKLKERKIDMGKIKMTSWREYIGLWKS